MTSKHKWQVFVRIICRDEVAGAEATEKIKEVFARALSLTPVESVALQPYSKFPGSYDVRLRVDSVPMAFAFDDLLAVLGEGWDIKRVDDEMSAVLNVTGSASFVTNGVLWASVEATLG